MRFLPFAVLLLVVIGCTVLKTDPEKNVRDFITEFQTKIESNTGEEVLKLFKTDQSKESIMSAIHVLRNKEHEAISCIANFSQANILSDSIGLRAFIPVQLRTDTLTVHEQIETGFTIWLTETKDSYQITKLEGEKFYYEFLSLENQVDWVMNEREVMAQHQNYFRVKARLKEKFDSVVWVAAYGGNDYYYVTSANFDIKGSQAIMGVVDSLGENVVDIGLSYSLIGNPGILGKDLVEIYQLGQVGLFDIIKKKEIVPAEYEWIIPYNKGKVYALVMTDAVGWLDQKYQYNQGFPDEEAKKFYYSLSFIPEDMAISSSSQALLEMPDEQRFGSGTFITPAYLTSTGIFERIYSDFSMDGTSNRAGTESVAASRSFFGAVTDKLDAIITTISSEYLEGREQFYSENKINFVNHEGEIVASSIILSKDIVIKKIDSTMIEIKTTYEETGDYWPDDGSEFNLPKYTYFALADGGIDELPSNRMFPYTEFIKIDLSYVTGRFTYYNTEVGGLSTREQLSDATLLSMRNEILAEYGMIFTEDTPDFPRPQNYSPRYSYQETKGYLNEIDRHNVDFIEKLLGFSGESPTKL